MKKTDLVTNEYLIEVLSGWLGVSASDVERGISRLELKEAAEYLLAPESTFFMRSLRKIVQALLGSSSQRMRISITDVLKLFRNALKKGPRTTEEAYFNRIVSRARDVFSERGIKTDMPGGVICLSHDIDWKDCYDFAEELTELELSYNVRSTLNFLTNWNYRLDKGFLGSLLERGFEIGLHGTDHDIALAYRSRKKIREKLKQGRDELPAPIKGFRSPALSSSQTLFEVLDELGFEYDSSLYAVNPYGRGTESYFPYRYPGLRLWEIPLAVQDSWLFRDMNLSEEEAFSKVRRIMHEIVALKGTFVFCGHPGILRSKPRFFKMFLEECNRLAHASNDIKILKMEHCFDNFAKRNPNPVQKCA
ncbi:MAG: polysaccharide deacetylase family protein [Candidatus Omnitrophica bacterium]|nr:polysaccharide deacetylase family protein [Candidatus Omnitrophota bacterium]